MPASNTSFRIKAVLVALAMLLLWAAVAVVPALEQRRAVEARIQDLLHQEQNLRT